MAGGVLRSIMRAAAAPTYLSPQPHFDQNSDIPMLEAYPSKPSHSPISLTIERCFEVCLFLLVLTGFSTLVSTGALDMPSVLLVAMALFVRGFFLARGRKVVLPDRWTNYLTIA